MLARELREQMQRTWGHQSEIDGKSENFYRRARSPRVTPQGVVNTTSQILYWAIIALGLNVLVGYAGLTSLGHAGLFAITGYTVALMAGAGWSHLTAGLAAVALTLGLAAVARGRRRWRIA